MRPIELQEFLAPQVQREAPCVSHPALTALASLAQKLSPVP